ncbi:TPA: GTPase ObgE [Candidatus Gastranaerophilales bacterium HUM_12]|nr:gTPase obg [Fusobacterium sp. CAG:815]DAA94018.1 MAG TPA: GTPase ObgE [Candidatus Gastranaerophilales bacterium HUM_7]DAB01183.1 MAG TPA: GTPase ObgE [Candidatus Gastranaerophilales bacterium HUM_12]DAB05259.1 MAG TPA: GTPase ObgE [Candidatus Gastranaerophilales bacterium HUM_14]
MQFIDKAKIKISSGKGGNGVVAWRREKFVDKGGPAGGDGGKGGSVYLIADEGLSTLLDFTYRSIFKADNGENGFKKSMHGKSAKDLYLKVPVGTIVKDLKTDSIIADLTHNKQTVLVAKGGRGGRGNTHFCTPQNRAPQYCEPGEPGIERNLQLELKLIADVGLLGLPNAGKSTFISRMSSAKPKIADYPFTTIIPNLGVVRKSTGDGYVIADIPGLIEGASEGVGLGHDFLRHVERCRFLLHIVDGTEEDPINNYKIINKELEKYSEKLAKLFQIVAINKIDAIEPERLEELKQGFQKLGVEVFCISAVTGENLDLLKHELENKVNTIEKPTTDVIVEEDLEATNNDDGWWEVHKVNKNTYVVDGGRIIRISQVTDSRSTEQVIRFQNIMISMGIMDELKHQGVQNGDTIVVGKLELEYWDDEVYK